MMPEMRTFTTGDTTFEVVDGKAREAIENLKSVSEAYYYPDLSTAISDINNGVTTNALPDADGARVKVFTAENGRLTVTLLADVSESTTITVSKDIDLVLAGHKIDLTTVAAYLVFAEGTSCTINGEVAGSAITKEGINQSNPSTSLYFIETSADMLEIRGGEYSFDVNYQCHVVLITAGPKSQRVELEDCYLRLKNSSTFINTKWTTKGIQKFGGDLVMRRVRCDCNAEQNVCLPLYSLKDCTAYIEDCDFQTANINGRSLGIEAYGLVTVKNSRISAAVVADGTEQYTVAIHAYDNAVVYVENSELRADAPGSNASEERSHGIYVNEPSTVFVKNTKIYATHSGICNHGNLYVRGGILSGWSHGGLYAVHDTAKQVYLKDVQLWSGYYDGQFDMSLVGEHGIMGNCYIGQADDQGSTPKPGGDTYLDGCVFGYDGATGTAFCVRDVLASLETPNRLFISNSKLVGHGLFRAQGRDGQLPGEVHIGTGCNFTASNLYSDGGAEGGGTVEETNALYRKHYPGEELTAEDYNALVAFMSGAEVS